jgi:hypothetical protein
LEYEYYRHDTIEKVQSFNVSDTVKKRKSYYQLFRKSIADTQFLSYNSIVDFNTDLDSFINEFDVNEDTEIIETQINEFTNE